MGARWIVSCSVLAAWTLLTVTGCGRFFQEPVRVDDPAKDFLVRVKNQRGRAFGRVESARKGKGPFDLRVVMVAAWPGRKVQEKEADVLTLARTWVSVIRPEKPETAWVEFVDSGGRVLAWGLFQSEKGLFVGLGRGRSK